MSLPSLSQRPAASITFMSPQKNAIMPISPIAISTAVDEKLNKLSSTASIFPVNAAAITAITTKVTQMKFIIILSSLII